MFALIVGGGKVGSYLAQALVADGHKVVVLEKKSEVIDKVINEVDATIIHADGCDPEKLEEAGVRQVDLVVAVTGDDEDNLVVAQLAKHQFRVGRVIARVNNPRNQWLFDREWGVDVAVSAVHIIAKIIQEESSLGDIVTLLKLRKGAVVLAEVKIAANSPALNRPIKDLQLPDDAVFVAIVRGEAIMIPKGETVLEVGDEVLTLTSVSSEQAVAACLNC